MKESSYIAHVDMVNHLAKYRYNECKHTDGLFKYTSCDISFTLVVDYFGIKYKYKTDVKHLISSLGEKYTMKVLS